MVVPTFPSFVVVFTSLGIYPCRCVRNCSGDSPTLDRIHPSKMDTSQRRIELELRILPPNYNQSNASDNIKNAHPIFIAATAAFQHSPRRASSSRARLHVPYTKRTLAFFLRSLIANNLELRRDLRSAYYLMTTTCLLHHSWMVFSRKPAWKPLLDVMVTFSRCTANTPVKAVVSATITTKPV